MDPGIVVAELCLAHVRHNFQFTLHYIMGHFGFKIGYQWGSSSVIMYISYCTYNYEFHAYYEADKYCLCPSRIRVPVDAG